jgi:hypothetical protein
MRSLWSLAVFTFVLGLVTLAMSAVIVLLIGASFVLGLLIVAGLIQRRRVYARPVPCRICGGIGLIEWDTYDPLNGFCTLCQVCMGTGQFAPSLNEAVRRHG